MVNGESCLLAAAAPQRFTIYDLRPSDVFDVQYLVFPQPARRLEFGHVAGGFSDQCARERRADRDLPDFDVGFVVADDLVSHDLTALEVFEVDGRAEDTAAFGIEQRGVDDLRVRELALELGDASF